MILPSKEQFCIDLYHVMYVGYAMCKRSLQLHLQMKKYTAERWIWVHNNDEINLKACIKQTTCYKLPANDKMWQQLMTRYDINRQHYLSHSLSAVWVRLWNSNWKWPSFQIMQHSDTLSDVIITHCVILYQLTH